MDVHYGLHFKPFGHNKIAKVNLIRHYLQLKAGTHITNPLWRNDCCGWTAYFLRRVLLVFWLIALSPLLLVPLVLWLLIYCSMQIYRIVHGFVVLYCCCNMLCLSEYEYHSNTMQRVDDWSFITTVSSEVEERRFNFYRLPLYFVSVLGNMYYRYARYLAGLFRARLMSDDMIVYFVHLWSTVHAQFVYEVHPFTKQKVRIKGIIDDYSTWAADEHVAEFFDGVTFEVRSVFIDYDQVH